MTDTKEEIKLGSPQFVVLKIIDQERVMFWYKMKKQSPLRNVMIAYCEKTGFDMAAIRFRFEGVPIKETDTPSSLKMKDDHVIEAYTQNIGG